MSGEHPIKTHEERMSRTETKVDNLSEKVEKVNEKVVINTESTKSAHHRIDKVEDLVEVVAKLGTSVEHMVSQVTNIVQEMRESREYNEKKFESQDDRIDSLEKKGGKIAIWAWISVATAVFGALAGKFIL